MSCDCSSDGDVAGDADVENERRNDDGTAGEPLEENGFPKMLETESNIRSVCDHYRVHDTDHVGAGKPVENVNVNNESDEGSSPDRQAGSHGRPRVPGRQTSSTNRPPVMDYGVPDDAAEFDADDVFEMGLAFIQGAIVNQNVPTVQEEQGVEATPGMIGVTIMSPAPGVSDTRDTPSSNVDNQTGSIALESTNTSVASQAASEHPLVLIVPHSVRHSVVDSPVPFDVAEENFRGQRATAMETMSTDSRLPVDQLERRSEFTYSSTIDHSHTDQGHQYFTNDDTTADSLETTSLSVHAEGHQPTCVMISSIVDPGGSVIPRVAGATGARVVSGADPHQGSAHALQGKPSSDSKKATSPDTSSDDSIHDDQEMLASAANDFASLPAVDVSGQKFSRRERTDQDADVLLEQVISGKGDTNLGPNCAVTCSGLTDCPIDQGKFVDNLSTGAKLSSTEMCPSLTDNITCTDTDAAGGENNLTGHDSGLRLDEESRCKLAEICEGRSYNTDSLNSLASLAAASRAEVPDTSQNSGKTTGSTTMWSCGSSLEHDTQANARDSSTDIPLEIPVQVCYHSQRGSFVCADVVNEHVPQTQQYMYDFLKNTCADVNNISSRAVSQVREDTSDQEGKGEECSLINRGRPLKDLYPGDLEPMEDSDNEISVTAGQSCKQQELPKSETSLEKKLSKAAESVTVDQSFHEASEITLLSEGNPLFLDNVCSDTHADEDTNRQSSPSDHVEVSTFSSPVSDHRTSTSAHTNTNMSYSLTKVHSRTDLPQESVSSHPVSQSLQAFLSNSQMMYSPVDAEDMNIYNTTNIEVQSSSKLVTRPHEAQCSTKLDTAPGEAQSSSKIDTTPPEAQGNTTLDNAPVEARYKREVDTTAVVTRSRLDATPTEVVRSTNTVSLPAQVHSITKIVSLSTEVQRRNKVMCSPTETNMSNRKVLSPLDVRSSSEPSPNKVHSRIHVYPSPRVEIQSSITLVTSPPQVQSSDKMVSSPKINSGAKLISSPVEVQSSTKIVSTPVDVQSSTKMMSSPVECQSNTRMMSSPPQIQSSTRMMSSSPQVQSNTRMMSSSPQVQSNTRMMSSSPQVQSNTRMMSSPVEDQSNTRMMSSSPQVQSNTRMMSSPVEGQSNTRMMSSSPQVQSNTRMMSSPPQVQSNTRMMSSPVEDQSNTRMMSSPVEGQSNTRMMSSPPQIQSSTRMMSSPPQVQSNTRMMSSPPQVQSNTRMMSSPVEDQSNTRMMSSAVEGQSNTRMMSSPPQIQSNTRMISSPAEVPSSTKTVSSPVEVQSGTDNLSSATQIQSSIKMVCSPPQIQSSIKMVCSPVNVHSIPEKTHSRTDMCDVSKIVALPSHACSNLNATTPPACSSTFLVASLSEAPTGTYVVSPSLKRPNSTASISSPEDVSTMDKCITSPTDFYNDIQVEFSPGPLHVDTCTEAHEDSSPMYSSANVKSGSEHVVSLDVERSDKFTVSSLVEGECHMSTPTRVASADDGTGNSCLLHICSDNRKADDDPSSPRCDRRIHDLFCGQEAEEAGLCSESGRARGLKLEDYLIDLRRECDLSDVHLNTAPADVKLQVDVNQMSTDDIKHPSDDDTEVTLEEDVTRMSADDIKHLSHDDIEENNVSQTERERPGGLFQVPRDVFSPWQTDNEYKLSDMDSDNEGDEEGDESDGSQNATTMKANIWETTENECKEETKQELCKSPVLEQHTSQSVEILENSLDSVEIVENSLDSVEIVENSLDSVEIVENSLDSVEIVENSLNSANIRDSCERCIHSNTLSRKFQIISKEKSSGSSEHTNTLVEDGGPTFDTESDPHAQAGLEENERCSTPYQSQKATDSVSHVLRQEVAVTETSPPTDGNIKFPRTSSELSIAPHSSACVTENIVDDLSVLQLRPELDVSKHESRHAVVRCLVEVGWTEDGESKFKSDNSTQQMSDTYAPSGINSLTAAIESGVNSSTTALAPGENSPVSSTNPRMHSPAASIQSEINYPKNKTNSKDSSPGELETTHAYRRDDVQTLSTCSPHEPSSEQMLCDTSSRRNASSVLCEENVADNSGDNLFAGKVTEFCRLPLPTDQTDTPDDMNEAKRGRLDTSSRDSNPALQHDGGTQQPASLSASVEDEREQPEVSRCAALPVLESTSSQSVRQDLCPAAKIILNATDLWLNKITDICKSPDFLTGNPSDQQLHELAVQCKSEILAIAKHPNLQERVPSPSKSCTPAPRGKRWRKRAAGTNNRDDIICCNVTKTNSRDHQFSISVNEQTTTTRKLLSPKPPTSGPRTPGRNVRHHGTRAKREGHDVRTNTNAAAGIETDDSSSASVANRKSDAPLAADITCVAPPVKSNPIISNSAKKTAPIQANDGAKSALPESTSKIRDTSTAKEVMAHEIMQDVVARNQSSHKSEATGSSRRGTCDGSSKQPAGQNWLFKRKSSLNDQHSKVKLDVSAGFPLGKQDQSLSATASKMSNECRTPRTSAVQSPCLLLQESVCENTEMPVDTTSVICIGTEMGAARQTTVGPRNLLNSRKAGVVGVGVKDEVCRVRRHMARTTTSTCVPHVAAPVTTSRQIAEGESNTSPVSRVTVEALKGKPGVKSRSYKMLTMQEFERIQKEKHLCEAFARINSRKACVDCHMENKYLEKQGPSVRRRRERTNYNCLIALENIKFLEMLRYKKSSYERDGQLKDFKKNYQKMVQMSKHAGQWPELKALNTVAGRSRSESTRCQQKSAPGHA